MQLPVNIHCRKTTCGNLVAELLNDSSKIRHSTSVYICSPVDHPTFCQITLKTPEILLNWIRGLSNSRIICITKIHISVPFVSLLAARERNPVHPVIGQDCHRFWSEKSTSGSNRIPIRRLSKIFGYCHIGLLVLNSHFNLINHGVQTKWCKWFCSKCG